MRIADLRREYTLAGLRRADLNPDPIAQFNRWFEDAAGARVGGRVRQFCIAAYKTLLQVGGVRPMDLNACTLATADGEGRPSARIVLLKGLDQRGFAFFSHYNSRKGRELAENPHAALVFYWADLERQVCVTGTVTRLSRDESEAYFRTRPKGSRLSAWATKQSEPVENRAALDQRWAKAQEQYPGDEVPMPEHWGGYLLSPQTIEFWQGRPSRLHDRFRYSRQPDNSWRIERLSP
jgi:pyridoxamine 5'-phosphate oxidase